MEESEQLKTQKEAIETQKAAALLAVQKVFAEMDKLVPIEGSGLKTADFLKATFIKDIVRESELPGRFTVDGISRRFP
jgi:hypothetical protein